MKLAVSTYSLWQWCSRRKQSLEQAVEWIGQSSGASGIEVVGLDTALGNNSAHKAAAFRKQCEKLRLTICSYCTPAQLLVAPDEQRQQIDRVKHEIDIAVALGCPSMRHDVTTGFQNYVNYEGPQTFAAAMNIVIPAVREIADYGQSKGIKTSFENHGFYMQDPKRVEQLLTAVNHPNFGLTIDMGNFLCVDADPVDAVKRLAKYVIMAHVKDFHVKPKKQSPGPDWFDTPKSIALRGAIVGHGAIDIPAQLKLLKKAKYTGYLSLEFEGMEEPTRAVKLGIDYLKRELEKIDALEE
jgi:sugar phosphate isomerase/epimerase